METIIINVGKDELTQLIENAVRAAMPQEPKEATPNEIKEATPQNFIRGIHELAAFLRISAPRAQKLKNENVRVKVLYAGVGTVTESDVMLAGTSGSIIIGFNVRPSIQAARLAENESIQIKLYSIIYNAIEEIRSAMEGMMEPGIEEKILANVEVKETYKFDKATVAGCIVIEGKISRNNRVRLVRDGIVIYTGELGSLKRYKDDVKEVTNNMECGLTIKNYANLEVGDIVEAFEEVEVKRTL